MERAADPCAQCRSRPARYTLVIASERVVACLRCFCLSGVVVKRAVLTALVVGTALTAINQGDVILRGDVQPLHLLKIPLTYAVPYAVTTWGALSVGRIATATDRGPP